MSVFEIIMLICFGASWPFSIAKTYRFKTSGTKSYFFLWLVVIGYIAGIIHKYLYSWDWVVALYMIDASMVATDMFLCYYYDWKNARAKSLKDGSEANEVTHPADSLNGSNTATAEGNPRVER